MSTTTSTTTTDYDFDAAYEAHHGTPRGEAEVAASAARPIGREDEGPSPVPGTPMRVVGYCAECLEDEGRHHGPACGYRGLVPTGGVPYTGGEGFHQLSAPAGDAPSGKLEIGYRTARGEWRREVVTAARFEARMEELDERGCYEFHVRDALATDKLGRVAL